MKFKYEYILLGVVAISMLVHGISVVRTNENMTQTSAEPEKISLSNKKIEWGIKRAENHEQPDLGKVNLELINKYNGIAIGNKEKKYVYLTFDNGYEGGFTGKILDTLKQNKVSATFFITAHYLNTASDMVDRMIKEGHIVRKSYCQS